MVSDNEKTSRRESAFVLFGHLYTQNRSKITIVRLKTLLKNGDSKPTRVSALQRLEERLLTYQVHVVIVAP